MFVVAKMKPSSQSASNRSTVVALHHFIFIIQNWWVCRKKSFYNACFLSRRAMRWCSMLLEWKARKMIDLHIIIIGTTHKSPHYNNWESEIVYFRLCIFYNNILIFFLWQFFPLFSSSHRRNGLQVIISFLSFITSFTLESSWHSSDVYNLLNQYWCSSH